MTISAITPLRNYDAEKAERRAAALRLLAIERVAIHQATCHTIRMVVTPWARDEHGNLARSIWAAE